MLGIPNNAKSGGEHTGSRSRRAEAVLMRLSDCLAELEETDMLATAAVLASAIDALRDEMAERGL